MPDVEELLGQIEYRLDIIDGIQDKAERIKYFENNSELFEKLKEYFRILLPGYQIKRTNDEKHREISERLKKDIIRIIKQKGLFEEVSGFEYYKSDIIEMLSFYEGKFAYNLQVTSNESSNNSALMYVTDRVDYISAIEESGILENNDINGISGRNYINNCYEENMIGHLLMQLKSNYFLIPDAQKKRILEIIREKNLLKKIAQKDYGKLNYYEKNFITQYAETILRAKVIFKPETVKDDELFQLMWNGQIRDIKIVVKIIEQISENIFKQITDYEIDGEEGIIEIIAEHFGKVYTQDLDVIMEQVITQLDNPYECAKFLANIDVPDDLTCSALERKEGEIEKGRYPFLPVNYYLKKIGRMPFNPRISQSFADNLITLIYAGYFTEEESEELRKTLENNYIELPDMTEDVVEFDGTEGIQELDEKARTAYMNRQILPLDIANEIIKQSITEKSYLISEEALKACVQSIICYTLMDKGIYIGGYVFFGNGDSYLNGNYDHKYVAIWINENLLKTFQNSTKSEDRFELIRVMFHEMQHAVQENNIDKGKIDYLTYNFIKEIIIEEYDSRFYEDNYESIFMESDARIEEILEALKFLQELNPEIANKVKNNQMKKYEQEREKYPIYKGSVKKMSIGENKIDISSYVGLLIRNNPQILTEYPILAVEYNADGTSKSIETMLQEFEQRQDTDSEESKRIYSIYYGIISKALENIEVSDESLREKINAFMSKSGNLVTLEYMENCYRESNPEEMRALYERIEGILHPRGNNHREVR